MRRRSAKKTKEQVLRVRVLQELALSRGLSCEAATEACEGEAVDGHEVLPRSAGGSATDPANILLVCRACHTWIHGHPEQSRKMGLLRSRYGDTDV